MTVKELIEELKRCPEDMEVMDLGYDEITEVRMGTWLDITPPYNQPAKEVVILK